MGKYAYELMFAQIMKLHLAIIHLAITLGNYTWQLHLAIFIQILRTRCLIYAMFYFSQPQQNCLSMESLSSQSQTGG